MITRPMLAVSLEEESLSQLSFPMIGSPKLDGIRCLKVNGKALTRTFKPIPNHFIREYIENNFPDGLDGEVMIDGAHFNQISSAVMSRDGEPDFVFYAFDYVQSNLDKPYQERLVDLSKLNDPRLKVLNHEVLSNIEEINQYENQCLDQKFEGIMLRLPSSPYKCGRSTAREQYLLKIKRFDHIEATIYGFSEKLTNTNVAEENELGLTKRSHAKDGMKPAGTLGKFQVKALQDAVGIKAGDTLEVGSGKGLTKNLRQLIWNNQQDYVGKIIRCKYQKSGAKDKPRFITFDGFRDEKDM